MDQDYYRVVVMDDGIAPARGTAMRNPPLLLLVLLTAVYVVTYASNQIFPLLMLQISREFHLTDIQIGELSGITNSVVFGVACLVVAMAADKLNRVRLIVLSATVFSTMSAVCGLAQGYLTLLAARLGLSIGQAGPNPPSLSLIAENFGGAKRPLANTIYTSATIIGTVLAYVVIGNVAAAYGWRTGFYLMGALGFLAMAGVALFLRDHARQTPQRLDLSDLRGFPALLGNPCYRWAASAAVLHTITTESTLQWLPLFMSRSLHMRETQIAWFLGINYSLLGFCGIFVGGYCGTWLRRRSVGSPMLLGCAIMALVTPCYALVCLSQQVLVSQIALCFIIMIANSGYGALLGYVQDVTPAESHGRANALFYLLMTLGWGGGTFLIGALSNALVLQLGAESLRFALLPVIVVAGAMASLSYFAACRSADAIRAEHA
jgi:MFS transporter, Spinster family, sphingosine-1-phosphate transporter